MEAGCRKDKAINNTDEMALTTGCTRPAAPAREPERWPPRCARRPTAELSSRCSAPYWRLTKNAFCDSKEI